MDESNQTITVTDETKAMKSSWGLFIVGFVVFVLTLSLYMIFNWNSAVVPLYKRTLSAERNAVTKVKNDSTTSKWKTFTSPSNLFTVKYPLDWLETEHAKETGNYYFSPNVFDQSDYTETELLGKFPNFPIAINEGSSLQSAGPRIGDSKMSPIVVDGISTLAETGPIDGTALNGKIATKIHLNKAGRFVTILLFNQKYADTFALILSTFHFK